MSQENVDVVRHPMAVKAQSHRRLEERIALLFPRTLAWLRARIERLPTDSRLRQVLLRRTLHLGIEALNRGDYEAIFGLHYHPDCEFEFTKLDTLGLEGTRGREDRIRFQERWIAEWGEFRFEPVEMFDLGDHRLLIVGHVQGAGLSSGAAFEEEWAALLALSAGWVIREDAFFDHAEALEAAGLSE
jgi:ketosteroid isomerase-like protein